METNYQIYQRNFEGSLHNVKCDMYAHQHLKNHHDLLVVAFECTPTKTGVLDEFEAEKMRQLEFTLIDLLEEKQGYHLGSVLDQNLMQHFFVTTLKEDLESFLRERIDTSMVILTKQSEASVYYYEVLYPNEKEYQHIVNQNTCLQLMRQGDLLKEPRYIEVSALFVDHEDALDFGNHFDETEVQVRYQSSFDFRTKVVIRYHTIPTIQTMNQITDLFLDLLNQLSGEYEGWSSDIVGSITA